MHPMDLDRFHRAARTDLQKYVALEMHRGLTVNHITVDVKNILSVLKNIDVVRTQDFIPESKRVFGSSLHEWHSVSSNIIMHIADFTALDSFRLLHLRPGYVCFEIAFNDPYIRHIEYSSSHAEMRTVQISASSRIEYEVESGKSSKGIVIFCDQSSFMKTFDLDIMKLKERERPIFLDRHGTFGTLRMPLFGDTAADIDEIIHCKYQASLRTIYIRSKAMQILCALVSQINESGAGHRLSLPQNFKLRAIAAAAKIYRLELRKPPNIGELANRVGVDRRELTRGFQEVYRTTPRGYLLRQRMEQAELLLEEGGKSLSEIGRIVGYQGYRTFVRAFQAFHGRPPMLTRKEEKK